MARSFTATKSKAGKEIECGRCGLKVEPGEKYFYFAVGFRGSKQIRCAKHHPRQSELTGSKMSGAYAVNEGIENELSNPKTTISSIASTLESAAEEIEQVRDEYQDSYDNLPDNFRDGDMGNDIQEKIDGLDEYANALNDKAQEIAALESEKEEEGDEPEADDTISEGLLEQAKDLAEEVLGEFSL